MARAINDLSAGAGASLHGARVRLGAVRTILIAAAFILALALFARIMAFPLRHDEQIYLPAGILFSPGGLYPELGFSHLPNLPILLNAIFAVTGTDQYLLWGRLAMFGVWLATAMALGLIAYRESRSAALTGLLVLLLIVNPLLLGPAGMIVSNNFMPVPFALFGLYAFLTGADPDTPRPSLVFLSGLLVSVAVGLKANYVFLIPPFAVAALLAPPSLPLRRRLGAISLPMLAGGIVGAIPMIGYLAADPQAFFSHVAGYHRGPHIAFWLANPDLDGAKVLSLGGKAALAYGLWLSGAATVILFALLFLIVALAMGGTARVRAAFDWKIALVTGLVGLAMLVSFVPTPSFPQYFTPPIPFMLVLIAMLFGSLTAGERQASQPFLAAAAIFALMAGAPMLAPALRDVVRPGSWTGNRVDAVAQRIRTEMAGSGGSGQVATLAPVYALEADLPVDPALAAGPFVYRVADLIPPADRRYYARLVSPSTIERQLALRPPSAILTGLEGALDDPLIRFARAHGYARRFEIPVDRGEMLTLYVAPPAAAARASVAPPR